MAVASTVFDFRDTMAINVERLATAATKSAGYGVTMQNDLKAMVILANVEWGSTLLIVVELALTDGNVENLTEGSDLLRRIHASFDALSAETHAEGE